MQCMSLSIKASAKCKNAILFVCVSASTFHVQYVYVKALQANIKQSFALQNKTSLRCSKCLRNNIILDLVLVILHIIRKQNVPYRAHQSVCQCRWVQPLSRSNESSGKSSICLPASSDHPGHSDSREEIKRHFISPDLWVVLSCSTRFVSWLASEINLMLVNVEMKQTIAPLWEQ